MVDGQIKQRLFPDDSKKSLQEAILWEKEIKEQAHKTTTESLTLVQWTNEYLQEAENRFVRDTFIEKKAVFVKFVADTGLCADAPVQDITVKVVRNYLTVQVQSRSGYAANKDRKNLATAWRWGTENMEGWPLGINPFLAVRRFPEERQPRYVPPEEDFWAVYNQSAGQDKVMLLTYLHLAARRSEVFHLQWDDVDFLNGRVRLWTRKRTGGHQEYDWLPMTTELKNALLLWRQERLRHTQTTKEYVFVCLDKTAFCEDYYGKPFIHRQHLMEKLCVKAKVKAFGFHGIRHLTASILYQKGYPLSVIQTILRHANPNTTARYIHSLGLEETRDALEEGLKGLGKVIEFHPKVVNA
jgi:integrase